MAEVGNDAPRDDAGRRGVTLSILIGIALGALVGVPRYGPFSVGNVALIGLGLIVSCGVYAIVVALKPGDATGPPS